MATKTVFTNKAAGAVIGGLAGLVFTVANPNFESRDFTDPINVSNKIVYGDNYGKFYGLSYAGTFGAIISLGYLALTSNVINKRRKR
jgi:hypothetical protein